MNFLKHIFPSLFGLCKVVGYQNVYRSGYFHRCGKPNMYDRHPGDLYPTAIAARNDIDPKEFYVDTCKVVWFEKAQPRVNSFWSKPVPLSTSRKTLAAGGEYVDGFYVAKPVVTVEEWQGFEVVR